jgi:hypothetical protein
LKKLFIFISFTCAAYFSFNFISKNSEQNQILVSDPVSSRDQELKVKVLEVEKLIKSNVHYNAEIGFFIDMRIPSMKNRFFIYNFKEKKIIDQGIVAHGSGSETGIEGQLKFSNVNNSLSTSLGKYSIGKAYSGMFGKAYKLHGLDQTNSAAFSRNIVLHKYEDVPYEEQENYICNSHGCPMVNEKFFSVVEKILDNSNKKIILTIYY